jgi:uncharacterized membrane protein
MKLPVKFVWKGNHHAYYGICFIAFGIFNMYMGSGNGVLESVMPLWEGLVGLGAFMLADDVVEHTVTSSTPLRILYEKLFRQ